MANSSTYKSALVTALVTGLLVPACDSGPTEPAGLQITIYSGDHQVASVDSMLPMPLAVRVTDASGRSVSNRRIRWTAGEHPGEGSIVLAESPSVTDAQGVARVLRRLGPAAGPQTTFASIEDVAAEPVRFTSIAQVQGATQMAAHPDDVELVRADTVLATLAAPFRVLVRDHNDVPIPGVQVSWVAPGGTLSSLATSTDENGVAEVSYTLGSGVGPQVVEARVPGLIGSPVRMEATAAPGTPVRLEVVGGSDRLGQVGESTDPYIVRATDSHGNPISGVVIDWAVTSGGGSVDPARTVTDDSTNHALATHVLGPEEGPQTVTATAHDLPGEPEVTLTTTAVRILVTAVYDPGYYCWYWGYGACNWSFTPDDVVVPAGSSLGWAWTLVRHDVTFEDDPAPPSSAPAQTTGSHVRTFMEPGTYRYRCTIHSESFTEGMVGTVTVQ